MSAEGLMRCNKVFLRKKDTFDIPDGTGFSKKKWTGLSELNYKSELMLGSSYPRK